MKIIIPNRTFAAGVICAAICFGVSASRASVFGNASWCAVVDQGAGNVMWNCEYDSVEECVPNVLAGNRGFCNINPYWRGADTRGSVARHWHQKRRVEQ